MQVTVMNGIWIQRKWNKSIPQQGRGHASIENMSARSLSTDPFYLTASFPRHAEQQEEEKVDWENWEQWCRRPHIEPLYKYKRNILTGPTAAISKDKINQWSSLEQLPHNGTHRELSFKIKSTIWNQYFWVFSLPMPLARRDSGCLTAWPRRFDELTIMSQTWCEWKIRQNQKRKSLTFLVIQLFAFLPGVREDRRQSHVFTFAKYEAIASNRFCTNFTLAQRLETREPGSLALSCSCLFKRNSVSLSFLQLLFR